MTKFFNQYIRKYWPTYLLGFLALGITNFATVRIPLEIKSIIDNLETLSSNDLKSFAITIAILAAIMFVARVFSRLLFFIPGRYIEFNIRNDLYQHLMKLPPKFYKENKIGDLMSRLINDLSGIRVFVALAALHIFNTTVSYILVFSQMFKISVPLTIYVILPIPFAMITVRFLVKKMYTYMVKYQELLGEVTNKIVESLSNIHLIKSYGIEKPTLNMFDSKNKEFLKNGIKMSTYRSSMFPFIGIIGSLGQCILFFVGGNWIIEGNMTVGEFTAMSMYLVQIVWPTASLAWIINIVQRGKASLKRVNKVFDAETMDELLPSKNLQPLQNYTITLKNLTFSYPGAAEPTLNNINLTIPQNSSLGIFGITGSGKSTLARLLMRLEDVPENSIFINDTDITTIPIADYWQIMAYVPQLAFLFSDSITNNIAYSGSEKIDTYQKTHAKTSTNELEKIKTVAKNASVYNDIQQFPNTFNTVIGEKGIILSGGQKKRISLARALFKNHQVLVLDDHLSAVDHETEQDINSKIFDLKHCTKIVISHRISALTNCDNIIVIENGSITAEGNHNNLLKSDGIYKDTWAYQQLENQPHEL